MDSAQLSGDAPAYGPPGGPGALIFVVVHRTVRTWVRLGVVLGVLSAAAPAHADAVTLPTPEDAQQNSAALLGAVGSTTDRLAHSAVPGLVVNDESVLVGLAGDGGVERVQLDQRLRLSGGGQFVVRERGPARSATSLNQEPAPVTRLGAVVWQGFVDPSRPRQLAARLTLDPLIEAVHLPLAVAVSFTGMGGRPQALPAGGRLPGKGTVVITLTDTTSRPGLLPTAADAPAGRLAPALDVARAAARRMTAARLPSTGHGLPLTVPTTGAAVQRDVLAVPLQVRGRLHVQGTTGQVTGPATSRTADGATLAGTLHGAVTFTVAVRGPGRLMLDLDAWPALDPRTLAPPRGASSWAAWAGGRTTLAERKVALDTLVQVAATGARAASYSPYLGSELGGTGSTVFHYAFAVEDRQPLARRVLQPRAGPIALLGAALLLALGLATAVWRRS